LLLWTPTILITNFSNIISGKRTFEPQYRNNYGRSPSRYDYDYNEYYFDEMDTMESRVASRANNDVLAHQRQLQIDTSFLEDVGGRVSY
jgi:hypothetical protein